MTKMTSVCPSMRKDGLLPTFKSKLRGKISLNHFPRSFFIYNVENLFMTWTRSCLSKQPLSFLGGFSRTPFHSSASAALLRMQATMTTTTTTGAHMFGPLLAVYIKSTPRCHFKPFASSRHTLLPSSPQKIDRYSLYSVFVSMWCTQPLVIMEMLVIINPSVICVNKMSKSTISFLPIQVVIQLLPLIWHHLLRESTDLRRGQ